jgi:putative toxin-antitoxin system antitoxin component (TIGR02293 family)
VAVRSVREGRSAPTKKTGAKARVGARFASLVEGRMNPADKVSFIRSGAAAGIVNDMVEYLEVSKSAVFDLLKTPESTAHKLIRDERPLDPGATERLMRVADTVRLAEKTFGGRDAAAKWLKTPSRGLNGETPLSMLDTEPGAAEVRRILSAINHGGVF